MKKTILLILFFITILSGCDNAEYIDTAKATTKAYFSNEPKIKYEYSEKVEDDFLKESFTEFSQVNGSTIDIYLDDNLESKNVSYFNPKVYTYKEKNENRFYIDFDRDKIKKLAEELAKKYEVSPIEPIAIIGNGEIEFSESEFGVEFDSEKLEENLYNALKNNEKYVKIESKEINPKYYKKDLREISDLLGTISTSLGDSTKNRIQNLTIASNEINNVILMPDETFSMNEILGDFTYDKGYVDAPVLINGVLTNDIAGGVCQISSTLYNTVLEAELEVVERKNHSSPVKYLPAGFDATLANGIIDFKFKNNTENPIVILASITDGNANVSIYGKEYRPKNRTIAYWSDFVKEIDETEYEYVLDYNKDADYKKITQEPKKGSVYYLYKSIYIDGVNVSNEFIDESLYKSRKGKIVLGENSYKKLN